MWSNECTDAFITLKKLLINSPVLSVFNPHRETELHTDAKLLQKQDDGKFHPVAYFTKVTSDDESRYHSFELETLAIKYTLEKCRNAML